MITNDQALAKMRARAADLVGVPWRLLGRDPDEGLDCIGALLEVFRAGGFNLPDVDPLDLRVEPSASPLWACFDPCPATRHGMPGDVALWANEDPAAPWSAHVAVVFGSQLFTANEKRGVHAVDMRRHLSALARSGKPAPRWFRLREDFAPC